MNWLERGLAQALERINQTLAQIGDEFPHVSAGSRWVTSPVQGWENTYRDWTAGFWPGILWVAFRATADERYYRAAIRWVHLLDGRRTYQSHDLGFLFYPSCAIGYEITGEDWLKRTALEAAQVLLERFDPAVGMLSLKAGAESARLTSVDTMMNLDLLWYGGLAERRERGDTSRSPSAMPGQQPGTWSAMMGVHLSRLEV